MTTNAHKLYRSALRDRDMMPVMAFGSAGTGKTYLAIEFAVEWLQRAKGQRVVFAKATSADEQGFLPGSEREKLEPWLRPLIQNFIAHGVGKSHIENLEREGRIVFTSISYIQGMTYDNTLVIVDECQNLTFGQLRQILTREGKWSKTVLCGDVAQTSPLFPNSGLAELIKMVRALDLDVHTIEFVADDIMRSERCKQWIKGFEKWDEIQAELVKQMQELHESKLKCLTNGVETKTSLVDGR